MLAEKIPDAGTGSYVPARPDTRDVDARPAAQRDGAGQMKRLRHDQRVPDSVGLHRPASGVVGVEAVRIGDDLLAVDAVRNEVPHHCRDLVA